MVASASVLYGFVLSFSWDSVIQIPLCMLRKYRPAAWLWQRMSCLCLVGHETRLWWFWCQFRRRPQVSPIINFGTAVSSMNSWAYCFSPEDVLWVLSVSDSFFYELLNCCCVSRRGKHISVQVLWVEYRKHRNMWTQWLSDIELYWVSSSFSVLVFLWYARCTMCWMSWMLFWE